MIQVNEKRAYKELITIINNMDINYKNRIPPKLYNFFEANCAQDYNFSIDGSIALKDQGLMNETKSLLALINLKYWCDSEEKRQSLLKIYSENERNYLKQQEEKFPTNIFDSNPYSQSAENQNNMDNNISGDKTSNNTNMIKYEKEKWYQKLFKKILSMFNAKSPAR